MKGIGSDSSKELRSFDIDTREMTSFDVAEALWEFVGQSVDDFA
jgi:hypothetical protein